MIFYNKNIFKRCFNYKGKHWYKNVKEIPLYFKLMHHLIKNGYDECATWETANWFVDVMKNILTVYRESHQGYPVASFYNEKKQAEIEREYDADLDMMISLLDDMDECNPKYDSKKYSKDYKLQNEEMNAAKDKFFELFSKHFYSLWD